jgi:hypothetical protein
MTPPRIHTLSTVALLGLLACSVVDRPALADPRAHTGRELPAASDIVKMQPTLPDLSLEQPVLPVRYKDGSYNVTLTVRNFTPVTALKSVMAVHVYDEDHNTLYEHFEQVGTLYKGQVHKYYFNVPGGDITRHPVLVVDLDVDNAVAESNEYNNRIVVPLPK